MLHLLNKKPYFELYGDDFPTPDGTAIRDYIHVLDLAEAHVLALRLMEDKPVQAVYNLGTGQGYSVREIISWVERITGKKVRLSLRPRRRGDVPILMASKEKAVRELQWEPRYSDIETIIRTAWKWHLYWSQQK
jgi:UDP-glucose 4-epimerase